MKFHNSIKTRILKSLVCIGFLATQTGCITGLVILPVGWPLAVAGGGLAIIGTGMAFHTDPHNHAGFRFASTLSTCGIILGEDNPGHESGLNEIPHSNAAKLGVTAEDIDQYNENLNQIQEAHAKLTVDIQDSIKYVQSIVKTEGRLNVESNTHLNAIAEKYGFSGAAEMIKVLSQKKLSAANLDKFAHSKGIGLDSISMRILLQTQFGIQVE